MPEVAVFQFLYFYIGVSVGLTIITFLFKKIILKHWFFYIPLVLAGMLFFIYGLIMLGYCLREYDMKREERKEYATEYEENEEEDSSIILDFNKKF